MKRITLAVVGLFAISAHAGTVNVTLTGLDGPQKGGYNLSPYDLTIGSETNVDAICDSFTREISVGESWKANVVPLSDYAAALFGGQANAQQKYEADAWLATLPQTADVQAAIWAIFDPAVESTALWDAGAAGDKATALGGSYSLSEFSDVEIVVPETSIGQEFLVDTPEPSALLLFGSALLGLGWLMRRLFVFHGRLLGSGPRHLVLRRGK